MFAWINGEFYFEMKLMRNRLNGILLTQTHVSCFTVKFGNVVIVPPPPSPPPPTASFENEAIQ
jgi:hypothetical protein